MQFSSFDLFKIGLGPSSSHTMGPMVAARRYALALREAGALPSTVRLRCELYGSLGATGQGHGSDKAVLLGLEGEQPESVDPDSVDARLHRIREVGKLHVLGERHINFDESTDLRWRRESLAFHPNGLRFRAFDDAGEVVLTQTYYSVGGGFIVNQDEIDAPPPPTVPLPCPFTSGEELLRRCAEGGMSIAQVMWRNELAWRSADEVRSGLLRLWKTMQDCVRRGLASTGSLPGSYKVRRRAPELYRSLTAQTDAASRDPLEALDWVTLYALAVSEENAAGGRVVTAPTNGAAGIVPAVLHYYDRIVAGASEQQVIDFLLTAAAIGLLYKLNASISGAEVGCQGEVGVACSMAAGALAAVMGGTPAQVENAAEIGMEHHLGLTCDPVGGQVQVPCIERNAVAAVKAITAARMALRGDGTHLVSLDQVVRTMRETGADMQTKYKETSRGGLAVNVVPC